MKTLTLPRRARRPQLEQRTPLVAIAAARTVVEEASVYLGWPLPDRYAAGLAHRARRVFAHSGEFREKLMRPGDRGRDLLHVFMRHWLAARLLVERPDVLRRLPADFRTGAPLTAARQTTQFEAIDSDLIADDSPLSPDARLLAEV